MLRFLGVTLAVLALWTTDARAGELERVLETPDSFGDQVIYYYDARADFTTFITLRNGNDSERTVSVLFYGPSFGTPFSKRVTLPGGRLTIIDVGGLRGEGLPAQPGVALATVVDDAGQAIATGALAGNFTVANLLTGSAFGAAGAARSALDVNGDPLAINTIIGVENGVLEPIRPTSALLAAFYDPATLAPVSASGNQLIFINFVDTYAPAYGATSGSTAWDVFAAASNGVNFPDTTFTATGVTVTDLASVLGDGVNGSAGGISFFATSEAPVGLNRLVYFAEALGTFGTGYLLPPIQVRPRANN
jgi:hypothetical protein